MDKPALYQIEIEGAIGQRWAEWFHNMSITHQEEEGQTVTLLTGCIPDQAVLLGMLQTIHNLGLVLRSLKRSDLIG